LQKVELIFLKNFSLTSVIHSSYLFVCVCGPTWPCWYRCNYVSVCPSVRPLPTHEGPLNFTYGEVRLTLAYASRFVLFPKNVYNYFDIGVKILQVVIVIW